ncbi:PadR family transcriptional regulator [Calidifontibacter sp. DB0510]|uniref:PadR family transcriptional regulator n=1 Tax=Metallococcus carri TaxID=1656884 RepID=A0A967B167_9MICO|nr:helix-turn-helix transcriptional regulator [Metallococcus carri]NHN55573.1 PadR family transcriptional regulator [Metallococcus carri]NOP38243.1 PadR family transcriptional regulator [Calidifontibacter sp. DB2511S]
MPQVPLSLAASAVLSVVAQGPTHGFAIARLFREDGELGRVWALPRPAIYRELGRLEERALITARRSEHGDAGPDRRVLGATAAGRALAAAWLCAPVERVREFRSEFLLKLALHERAGSDPGPLLAAQRSVFAHRVDDLRAAARAAEGFDRQLLLWRALSTEAALHFLDETTGLH